MRADENGGPFICDDDAMQGDLTVADLVADPALDTTVLAGARGLGRTVRWAQTSEIAHPWHWLGPDELLMTVGLSLPSDPEGQLAFVRALDDTGLSGLIIGDDGLAPALTTAMLEECDARDLPLLIAGPSTPFVAIARTVAAATATRQSRSVLLLSRIYQAAGRQDISAKREGRWIAELCGTRVAVLDERTGSRIIGEAAIADEPHRAHALRTIRPTHLLIPRASDVDAMTLVHLTQILTVDANVLLQSALTEIAAGSEYAHRLLDGHRAAGPDRPFVVVATDAAARDDVAMSFALREIRPYVVERRGRTLALVDVDDVEAVQSVIEGFDLTAGVSAETTSLADLGGAIEEATSALSHARSTTGGWLRHERSEVSLLARSPSEAAAIVETVLGPLAEPTAYAALRSSLFALLDHDLHWHEVADGLGIHRQTLAYRMRRVEQLTGRRVQRVRDVAELWLARCAWRTLHGDPPTLEPAPAPGRAGTGARPGERGQRAAAGSGSSVG